MTTRSIVTSHPDVACDVCARRLLRGEQPDYFIADGRRRLVCELCAPRATHEGWLREAEAAADVSLPPSRPRRGRSLFDRLIQVAKQPTASPERPPRERGARRATPYDLFGGSVAAAEPDGADEAAAEQEPAMPPTYLELAVVAFNASEYPRRVAGVARSLGEPVVSVRSAEHLESVVRIVVAWELSWYRYEVDVGEEPMVAEAAGQGTEISELGRDEREGNALATPEGAIVLAQ
ncbi:MAG: hypothetical protein QOK19_1664 [Solirubrobacteraceae bacterium]|jgi:hypothetical protein|nr:hypothetical protein [Solirubrobacteraceae bacterium]